MEISQSGRTDARLDTEAQALEDGSRRDVKGRERVSKHETTAHCHCTTYRAPGRGRGTGPGRE